MSPARVGVVGLGVAGATVALLLSRQGHDVTLFEQTPVPGPAGAGVLLQPSGQLVLQRLGLLDRVTAQAEPIERLHALSHRGRVLVNLAYEQLEPGLRAYGVHRGVLFTALCEELARTGVTMRLGTRVTRWDVRPDAAELIDDAGRVVGVFDFVLACDGSRSALRASAGIPFRLHEYPHGALWATGHCPEIRGELLQLTYGSKHLCGLLPTGGGQCTLFWSLDKKDHAAWRSAGIPAWRRKVLRLCPQAQPLFAGLESPEQVRYTTYVHVRMPRPFNTRCLFLGDAGHAMSPHLGQGINLALIDAWCFAQALAAANDFASACKTYWKMRRSHLRVYSALTYLMSPFFQSRGFVKGMLRDIGLPLMPKIPPLRKQMVLTMAGLRCDWLGRRFALDG